MTTNTTKIAEAIGILSSVLSDEVASAKHFVEEETEEVDLDEFVTADEYEELKEAVTESLPAVLTDLDTMKANIGLVVDVSDGDCTWMDERWNDDEVDENEGEEASEDTEKTPTPEPTDAEKAEALTEENKTLKEEKEILRETLKTLYEALEEVETALTDLQDDVEEH
jgi:AAA+ superfamily predicted ATPase